MEGILNYLTMFRLDIAFTIVIVSQFLSASRTTHLKTVMRILRYMKKALGRALLYSDQGYNRVACFSDADWT